MYGIIPKICIIINFCNMLVFLFQIRIEFSPLIKTDFNRTVSITNFEKIRNGVCFKSVDIWLNTASNERIQVYIFNHFSPPLSLYLRNVKFYSPSSHGFCNKFRCVLNKIFRHSQACSLHMVLKSRDFQINLPL